MKTAETVMVLIVLLTLWVIALVYGTGGMLIAAILVGIVSGALSYYISRDEIKKIVNDDEVKIEIVSKKASCVILVFGIFIGVLPWWGNNPISFTSFIAGLGLFVIVATTSIVVLTTFARLHPPTHDLRIKKD